VVVAQTTAITDEQAREEGLRIENGMMSGSPSALDNFLDFDRLMKRVQTKSEMAKDPGFLAGARQSFLPISASLGERIRSEMRGGSFRLLKVYEDHGVRHVLFRLYTNPGLNYMDFRLIRVRDSIKSDDYFLYNVEDWISGSLAALVNVVAASARMNEEASATAKLMTLVRKKDYAGAKAAYDEMDSAMRNTRILNLLYVRACKFLGDTLYLLALNAYVDRNPNAPSGCLMLLDLAVLKKDYDMGLRAVDRLDSLVGGDPFLNFHRATFLFLLGKKEESLACHQKAFEYDPSIRVNSIDLAAAYSGKGQNDKAKEVLEVYKKTRTYHEGDLDEFYSKHPELK
jgi:tetratricopeptide (TPR) repeat protein